MKALKLVSPLLLIAPVEPFLIPLASNVKTLRAEDISQPNIDTEQQSNHTIKRKKWGFLDGLEEKKSSHNNNAKINPPFTDLTPDNYICENGICRLKDSDDDINKKNDELLFVTNNKDISFVDNYIEKNSNIMNKNL